MRPSDAAGGGAQTKATGAVEANFDGLVGPSHNYGGLSLGNIASSINAGSVSRPRAAALAGIAKMRRLMELGLPQGFLLPQQRPNLDALHAFGFRGSPEQMCAEAWQRDPALFVNLLSASAMWTANAATVSPSADTDDGRLHVTTANLASMLHRSLEASFTYRQLRLLLPGEDLFAVHPPIPGGVHLGDEGAANHARLAADHGSPGVELFAFNDTSRGRFPGRHRRRACESVARSHGLNPERTIFAQQSHRAVDAGAFHNDVVCLTNGPVMLVHQLAFEHQEAVLEEVRTKCPDVTLIEVAEEAVPLTDVIASYLFNSQLVSIDEAGAMALVLPEEVKEHTRAAAFVQDLLGSDNPVTQAVFVDVRESMRNGGGPACLRLRIVLTPEQKQAIDRRFLLDDEKARRIEDVVTRLYPEEVDADLIGDPLFHRRCFEALHALTRAVDLGELLDA